MVGWGKMHNVDLMIFQGVDADTMLVKIDRGIRHMHTIIDLSNLWVTRIFNSINLIISKKLDQKTI